MPNVKPNMKDTLNELLLDIYEKCTNDRIEIL